MRSNYPQTLLQNLQQWNPLEEIRLGTEHEVGDVQNLATLIVYPDGRGLETHWQKSGEAILVGLILHALYLVCQDINQLKSAKTGYGQDESITSNCHIRNAFPPNRVETAEHLSQLTGQTTIVKEQVTKGGKQTSRTQQEVQRSLLTWTSACACQAP